MKLLYILGGAALGYTVAYLVANSRGQPGAVSLTAPTYVRGVIQTPVGGIRLSGQQPAGMIN